MKFILAKASNRCYKDEIEINSIDELINFVKKEWPIILEQEYIDRDTPKNEFTITIYDDYIE